MKQVTYIYGVRFYDSVIARWTSVDLLMNISRRWFPFNYGENNPTRMIDLNGMWAENMKRKGYTTNEPD